MTTHDKALDAARHMAPGRTLDECAEVADPIVAAYLSALLPEDVAGMVERLQLRPFEGEYVLPKWAREREQAASLIQSQAARIAERDELIAAFVRANDEGPGLIDCIDNHGERYTSAGLDSAIRAARSLLNKERESHD